MALVRIGPSRTSRVVISELGHGRLSHLHAAYQRLAGDAILWSAGKLE